MALPIGANLVPATILNGQSLSGAIGVAPGTVVGISMPASWDAAGLTFQVCSDGTTFQEMPSITVPAPAAAQYIALDPAMWRGVMLFKVRSGTSGVPVNQTADRVLNFVTKTIG